MRVAGIDPGAYGAIAVYDTVLGTLHIRDMPTRIDIVAKKKRRRVDAPQLHAIIADLMPHRAIMERVGSRPGQGVSSMFAFGAASGIIEGVLSANEIAYEKLTPQQWHRLAKLRGGPQVKANSRAKATLLFPAYAELFKRVKDDGRSDAALMAWVAAYVKL